jgi:hypothetical protein
MKSLLQTVSFREAARELGDLKFSKYPIENLAITEEIIGRYVLRHASDPSA